MLLQKKINIEKYKGRQREIMTPQSRCPSDLRKEARGETQSGVRAIQWEHKS